MAATDTLEQRKAEATKLVSDIKSELSAIEKIQASANQVLSNIIIDDKNLRKTSGTLNRISGNIDNSVAKFNEERLKISVLLKDADKFFKSKYLPLVNKIENPESGFNAKIKSLNILIRELDKIEKDCLKKYTDVKTTIIDFQTKVRQLKTLDSSIRRFHVSSEKNATTISSKLDSITQIEKDSKALSTNINKLHQNSQKLIEQIKLDQKSAGVSLEKIEGIETTSTETLEKIQEIYDIAAETGRSGEFENRRNKLKSEVDKWEKRILQVSGALLSLVIGLFVFQLGLNGWDIKGLTVNFYLRYLLLSPIVYYLIFCASQHNKIQKLYDKYSFKTTLAMSVKHHIELLLNQGKFQEPDKVDKVLDFVLDAFGKIYNEPYSDEDYKLKLKLANIELDIENKLLSILKPKE